MVENFRMRAPRIENSLLSSFREKRSRSDSNQHGVDDYGT